MRFVFTIAACVGMALDRYDGALVAALLAVAWALPGRDGLRRWLGWDESLTRARSETLFDGRHDDT